MALAWVYSDETTETIRRAFEQLSQNGAWVPLHWHLEVANVLQMGVRRGRHDAAFRDSTLADLAVLPIQTDSETERHAWGKTLQLAESHRLTLYDAAYLELALRRELPLATVDHDLRIAAKAESITLLGA